MIFPFIVASSMSAACLDGVNISLNDTLFLHGKIDTAHIVNTACLDITHQVVNILHDFRGIDMLWT